MNRKDLELLGDHASRLPLTPVISASDLSKRRLRGSGGYKCSCKLWVEHLY